MREPAYLCVHWLCAWDRWKQEECVRFSRPVPLCWGKSSSAAQAVTYDVSQTFLRRISKFLLLPPEGWDSRCEPIPLPKYFFKELFRAMLAIHHFSHSRDSWWLLDNRCLYFFFVRKEAEANRSVQMNSKSHSSRPTESWGMEKMKKPDISPDLPRLAPAHAVFCLG